MNTGKLDILIPTLKPLRDIRPLIDEIRCNTVTPHRIIASCQNTSAARNRNFCLEASRGDILIMVDDDITEFCINWETRLLKPFADDFNVCMVSARLVRHDGQPGPMCCGRQPLTPRWVTVHPRKDCVIPSAAIAFRNYGLRFDESFIGSGWEDNDFCFQYLKQDERSLFLIANDCRLIHKNEMKNQNDGYFNRNRRTFYSKWGLP